MFIIEYLPEIFIHAIFIIGVFGVAVGFVLGFIPFIKQYKLAFQIIGGLLLVIGLFLEGGLADNKIWQQRVAELESKVKESEAKSAAVNTVIKERVVTKTNVVKQKAQEVIKYVDRDVIRREEVIKYVDRCSLPQDLVDAHNKAVDELNKAGEKQK